MSGRPDNFMEEGGQSASTPPKVSLGPISNIFSLSSYGPFDGVEEHLLANRRVTPYIGLADGSKCERFDIDNRQPKCLNRGGSRCVFL